MDSKLGYGQHFVDHSSHRQNFRMLPTGADVTQSARIPSGEVALGDGPRQDIKLVAFAKRLLRYVDDAPVFADDACDFAQGRTGRGAAQHARRQHWPEPDVVGPQSDDRLIGAASENRTKVVSMRAQISLEGARR